MQQGGRDEQDCAEDCGPCTVSVAPIAVAFVGSVTVVSKAALHFGSRAAAMSLVTESFVCARLHHCVGSRDGGAGVGILRARAGALLVAFIIIGGHARVTLQGVTVASQRDKDQKNK